MLRGWPVALVGATGASAVFAFGVVQSAFTPQAQALFIVFAAVLLMLSVANHLFRRGREHPHGDDHAVVMSGKVVGAIAIVSAVFAVIYFWNANQLSGEKIGRYLDRGAVSLSQQAQTTFERLTDGRAEEISTEEVSQDG